MIDQAALHKAAVRLGIEPDASPTSETLQPPTQTPPYHPLSEDEWQLVHLHVSPWIAAMRPQTAGRAFIESLLICEHSKLGTRYLRENQESTRQRALRWSLDGRLERLAADLRTAGQLSDERLAAFDAIAAKAKQMRERIVGSRATRLDERTAGSGAGAV